MAKSYKIKKEIYDESEITNFEDILNSLGGFGRYQIFVLCILLFFEAPAAALGFIPVFIGATPNEWLCNDEIIYKSEVCKCNGTLSSISKTSIVSEWNLICSLDWLPNFITTIQVFGMITGNFSGALISDWYGRKKATLTYIILQILSTSIGALAFNPYIFLFSRFLLGIGFSGLMATMSIYPIEFMPKEWRAICASLTPFGVGSIILGILAYVVRPWRELLWIATAPFVLIIVAYPFIPESPRWLLRNQKIKECHEILSNMAKFNRRIPISIEKLKSIAEKENFNSETEKVHKVTFLEFFQTKSIRKLTFLLGGIWFFWGIIFFGLNFNVNNLNGDPYITVILLGLSESIAYPISFFINNKMGRRKAIFSYMAFASICLLGLSIFQIFFDYKNQVIFPLVLLLLTKAAASGARSCIRTMTGESYPTSARSKGIGILGISCCVGTSIAPQFVYLGQIWPSVPTFAFVICSMISAITAFLLDETNGELLQDEITRRKSAIGTGTNCPNEKVI